MLITFTTFATLNEDLLLTVFSHISHNFVGISFSDYSTNRNFNYNVFAVCTKAVSLSTVLTRLCFEHSLVSEIQKCVHTFVSYENNVTAFTTVATIWATVSNILCSEETYCTITTVSTFNVYSDFIDKHFITSLPIYYIQ